MAWFAAPSGKRGRSQVFSDASIQFCLSIKGLFHLPLRQCIGMVESLLKLAHLDWPPPGLQHGVPSAKRLGRKHSLSP